MSRPCPDHGHTENCPEECRWADRLISAAEDAGDRGWW